MNVQNVQQDTVNRLSEQQTQQIFNIITLHHVSEKRQTETTQWVNVLEVKLDNKKNALFYFLEESSFVLGGVKTDKHCLAKFGPKCTKLIANLSICLCLVEYTTSLTFKYFYCTQTSLNVYGKTDGGLAYLILDMSIRSKESRILAEGVRSIQRQRIFPKEF